MKIPVFILILFLSYSCKEKGKKSFPEIRKPPLYTQKKANYEDSFNIYSGSLGMKIKNQEAIFSVQELNKRKYAFLNLNDSLLYVYDNENGKWIKKQSIVLNDTYFDAKVEDLNDDGNKDFVFYGFPNMHGNCRPYVFLSGSGNELVYRPDLSLYNIEYDIVNKLIRSHYTGGVLSTNYKEYYKWNNDSLLVVKGVKRQYINDSTFITSFFRLKNGKEVVYREVKDNTSDVFDKAFWEPEY